MALPEYGEKPQLTSEPLLCWNWLCPYVHRVTLALAHKKAHIAELNIQLPHKPTWFAEFSPLGKVPAVTYLEDGEQAVLYESMALMDWVNNYYTDGPSLLPSSAAKTCLVRIISSRFDSIAVPTWYKMLRGVKEEDFSPSFKTWHAELTWLEGQMQGTGPYFMGAAPTLVDTCIAPWLLRVFVIQHWRGVDLLAGHAKLQAWVNFYKALPEVAATYRPPAGEPWEGAMSKVFAPIAIESSNFSKMQA
eukprot:CAMPEP_0119102304 /NCGR_PEP_ID=MMETSP1180-20130426/1086_1 /TAXON_ID=3052 ORGANISM="Chlamydomonas cf sp, Strain CCMP681" /NCGR_SAMPLE_ID=MMETSP1180 /ASSEMBLY_ACC=CAM_ASM_000741 /LENGTH=246 /DNA_ID=CAMNT_0007086559 /DNA_START=86 /DNA_END=826 /DNA_ORIENTATION=+